MPLIDGWSGGEEHRASGRFGWAAYDRRQLRYIDAVRLGLADEARRLAGEDLGTDPWRVGWASGSDLDPRLREQLYVGPVESMAWVVADDRPFVAVVGAQVRVWDLLGGRHRLIPAERVRCLAFAASDVLWLVTGHDDGFLRIWDVAGGSLRAAIKTGDSVTGLRVVDTGDGPEAVTLHAHGHLVRWSLRSGKRVQKLKGPKSNAICEGWLADGRHVLASGGDELALWDLAGGLRIELPITLAMWKVVDVQLSYVAGRDCLTVLNPYREVLTFDLESGEPIAPPVRDHMNRWGAEVMRAWGPDHRRPRLATISGTVAVPTAWRVHLWDLEMSTQAARPLAGPVAQPIVKAVRWRGQDYLLTGSGEDGVVALWDLGVKAPPVMGNEERVTQIVLAGDPQTVVSVDRGGTIVARRSETGALTVHPLETGIEHTNAVVAWSDGGQVFAATAAGSRRAPHRHIRRWNIATGFQEEPAIAADQSFVSQLGLSCVAGQRMLMALGPERRLRLWDAADGRLRVETRTQLGFRPVNGFATAVIQGRPAVVISAYYKETTVYFLDGMSPTASAVPHVGTDFVVGLVEGRIVMGANDEKRVWRTIRVWDLAGASLGPVVRREAGITAVALSGWPEAFVATSDRMVSLVNLETGLEVCPALCLPRTAHALAVTADGDLIAGFGSDVARFRPPGREPGPAK